MRATAGQLPVRALSELLAEPLYVPRTTPVARLFTTMKQRKVHLALVVSEYGKLLGLVTMDDLLALLFGDIHDERDGLQRAARRGRGGRTPLPGSLATIDQSAQVPRLEPTPDDAAPNAAVHDGMSPMADDRDPSDDTGGLRRHDEYTPPPPPGDGS